MNNRTVTPKSASSSAPNLKPIPGFDGYFACSEGFIWSLKTEGGAGLKGIQKRKPTQIRGTVAKSGKGYLCVTLRKDGKSYWKFVHRLILETWFGPCPIESKITRHIDGNKFNNKPSNLVWGTYIENEEDKKKHGTRMLGSKHHHAKLTEDLVTKIRMEAATKTITGVELSEKYNVTCTTIYDVINGKIWKHVPMPENSRPYKPKLKEEDVKEIKRRSKKERAVVLADEYGISRATVYDILRGKTWIDV